MLLLIVMAGLVPMSSRAAEKLPSWRVPYLPGVVKIDGRLDDAQYAKAFRWDRFVETSPGDNTQPSRKTGLYLFSTNDALVVGVQCFDPHPEQIQRTRHRRDQGADEYIEVSLDTFGAGKQEYVIDVSPMNDISDGTFDPSAGAYNGDFDLVFEHGARIGADGWSAEIRIPFTSINYLEKSGTARWLLYVDRDIPRKSTEEDTMLPLDRSTNDPLDGEARILLTHLPPPPAQKHWRVIPSWVVSRIDTRDHNAGKPAVSTASTQGTFGITGEWIPSSNTSVKATIHPDFSEVEADDTYQRINNRYPVFFPEKRPFFMDGMESFKTPIHLLDTRNIVQPELGLKFSTKGKRFGFYGISALEQDVPPERFGLGGRARNTWWHILRATWDTKPKGSFIGAMATERDFGSDFNRVISIDGVQRANKLTVVYQGAGSETRAHGDTRTGNGALLDLAYKWSRYFKTYLSYEALSPDFRSDAGFVQRVDFRSYQLSQNFDYQPKTSKPLVKHLFTQMGYSLVHNYRSKPINRAPYAFASLTLEHRLNLQAYYQKDHEEYHGVIYPTRSLTTGVSWWEHPRFQPFVSYTTGHSILYGSAPRLVDQKTMSWGFTSDWGPLSLRLDTSDFTFRERAGGALDRAQRSYEVVAHYIFNDHTNFKIFYIHERASLYDYGFDNPYNYINLLFTWRKNAFTRVYVGLTHSRDVYRDLTWAPFASERQTIGFVKVTWLFD